VKSPPELITPTPDLISYVTTPQPKKPENPVKSPPKLNTPTPNLISHVTTPQPKKPENPVKSPPELNTPTPNLILYVTPPTDFQTKINVVLTQCPGASRMPVSLVALLGLPYGWSNLR
jgi:hypothetical protein